MSSTIQASTDPFMVSKVEQFLGHPEFSGFFEATVRGMDDARVEFECNVRLDGYLGGDLYLKLNRKVEALSALFVVLRFMPALNDSLPSMRLALHVLIEGVNHLPSGESEVRARVLDCQML